MFNPQPNKTSSSMENTSRSLRLDELNFNPSMVDKGQAEQEIQVLDTNDDINIELAASNEILRM